MLIARNSKGKIIRLWNSSVEERQRWKREPFDCPACQQPVILKNGEIKRAHFAHVSNENCQVFSEGETEEHLAGKQIFAEWCAARKIKYEVESYLPKLEQRPDILLQGGITVEFQCSLLSIEKMSERTRSYQKHGYHVLWILGEKLHPRKKLTHLQTHFLYFDPNVGYYLWGMDVKRSQLILWFHIEETSDGRLFYQKKEWSFDTNLEIGDLQFPKIGKIVSRREYDLQIEYQKKRRWIGKRLYYKDKKMLAMQARLYQNHQHLLGLNKWFYFPVVEPFFLEASLLQLLIRLWEINGDTLFKEQNFLQSSLQLKQLLKTSRNLRRLPNCKQDQLIDYFVAEYLSFWKGRKRDGFFQDPLKGKLPKQVHLSRTPLRNMIR